MWSTARSRPARNACPMSDKEPRHGRTRTGRVCDVAAAMEKRDSHSDFDDVVRLLGRAAQHSDSPGQAQPLATRTTREETPLPGVLARADRAPFVGREALLRELDERWAAAERGGRLVVLTGEPGIGKTRLAARFAAATGAAVLYGRADEESVSPFQPFVEALRYYAARHPGVAERGGTDPRGHRGAGPARAGARPVGRGAGRAASGGARPRAPPPLRRRGAAAAARRRPPPAAARDRRPAVGRRADAAPAAPAAAPRSRRPAARARDLQRARGARDGPAAPARRHAPRGARGHHPRRRNGRGGIGGAGRRARRAGAGRRRGGAAAARPDRRQSLLHRRAAARPRRGRVRAGRGRAAGRQGPDRAAAGAALARGARHAHARRRARLRLRPVDAAGRGGRP